MTTGHGHETPDVFGAAFWDQRYGASSALWSGDPNTTVSAARARPSIDPDGHTITIHDAVLRAVRQR